MDEKSIEERIAEAQERQADALEIIAGMLMLEFESNDDRRNYSIDTMREDAHHYATGELSYFK